LRSGTHRHGTQLWIYRIHARRQSAAGEIRWHTDHTDGNAWLHSAGAFITAHENTRKRLSVATRVEGWNWTFPAAPAGALPAKVFASEYDMRCNDTHIHLKYYGPAHTDSDISVYFADADVVHVGDTWWNGVYPFIDYSTGGSIDGQIRAADANLAMVTDKTVIIPGHGPAGRKSDVMEFRDMLVTIRHNVATLKRQGDPWTRQSPLNRPPHTTRSGDNS
jgi:glyoxylase-like metal-dependent hydrolase (beta-lactamase superfamily II)